MEYVESVPMLRALLALQSQREVAQTPSPLKEAEKYGEAQFTALLDAGIEYCNNPKHSADLKDGIRAWYAPLLRLYGTSVGY